MFDSMIPSQRYRVLQEELQSTPRKGDGRTELPKVRACRAGARHLLQRHAVDLALCSSGVRGGVGRAHGGGHGVPEEEHEVSSWF